MRTFQRFLFLALVVAPVAYWILGGGVSLPSLSAPSTVYDSRCDRVDWHYAPAGAGRREWVATMEGAQDDPQVVQWLRMTDAERGGFLAQCGKER